MEYIYLKHTPKNAMNMLGFTKLREAQEASLQAILDGNDVINIMPTGGGKSAVFQIPALCFAPALTLVLSPLKALQADQVAMLQARHIEARLLNSSLSDAERQQVFQDNWKWLEKHGWKVGKYHGKQRDKKRATALGNFLSGEVKIMVATNAFGLGIDKPGVRLVIHARLPLTIDGYVQKIGWAGRDGKDAECVLIYSPSDVASNKTILSLDAKKKAAAYSIKRLEALRKLISSDECLWKGIEKNFSEEPGKKCGKCLQKKFKED